MTAHGTATEAIDLVTDWLGRLGRRPERQVLQVAKLAFGVRITPDEQPLLSARLDAIRDKFGALLPFAQLLEARVLMQDRRGHSAAKQLLEARTLIPQPTKNSVCLLLTRCHAELGSFDEELADCRQVERSIDSAQAVRADSTALSAFARLGQRGALRSDADRADVTAARIRITARHRGAEEALRFESEHAKRKADSFPILIASVTRAR